MVWISTRGGANSGKTSTLVFGISANPSDQHGGGREDDEPAEAQAAR